MRYKNIIFDLDGTLWDSRTSVVENWNEVLFKYRLLKKPLKPEDMNSYMGLLANDVLKDMFPEISDELINTVLKEILESESESIRKYGGIIYKDVEPVLKELKKKYNLFIVSNCQDGYIEAFLGYFEFHYLFKDFESHGRTGKNKAENIKLVLERNQLTHCETVYIGDTETDCKSSKENNLDFIFCEYGFGQINTNFTIKSIKQFNELLQLETM